MKRTALLLLLLFLVGAGEYDATSCYETRSIEGWNVLVNKTLLAAGDGLAQDVIALLRVKLFEVARVLPEKALGELRRVPIWIELKNDDCPGACYHPSKKWLTTNGYNPEKARSIEIGNARNFLSWSLHQPFMMLHELAHAYHHRVLGYDDRDIRNAYEEAKKRKAYEAVLRYDGSRVRAYAMNNDQEYFAELSEAYFGTNDFYPFVRAEVREHDPLMFETLTKVWGRGDR
jgi:hypothetical protein